MKTGELKLPMPERFWSKVDRFVVGGCWHWTSNRIKSGYGNFTVSGKKVRAHRVAWEISNGKIANGLHVLHKCDVPICVNPEHLFLGTHADNMRDMHAKGRVKWTRAMRKSCPKGHAFSVANTYQAKTGRICRACVAAHARSYRASKKGKK